MTSSSGQVGYASGLGGFGESMPRTSIAALVFALARRKDLPQFKFTLGHIVDQLENTGQSGYVEYQRYYQAQALFQGDVEAWKKWNQLLIRQLKSTQAADGSIPGQYVPASTPLTLLALSLNYRFCRSMNDETPWLDGRSIVAMLQRPNFRSTGIFLLGSACWLLVAGVVYRRWPAKVRPTPC